MKDNIIEALNYIDPSSLKYQEWLSVGMALKAESYDCSVWDEWSRSDPDKYHKGECERKWRSFNGSANPITGATIVQLAKERGYSPKPYSEDDGCIAWEGEISYDGQTSYTPKVAKKLSPSEQLIKYIETLFKENDFVGYVSNDVSFSEEHQKYEPLRGAYYFTASQIISSLKRYGDRLEDSIGDYKKEAGAWIRINPLDGKGAARENVTRFDYALVESDEISKEDQLRFYHDWKLPIAALVDSAGKSVHAIVKINAETEEMYQKRVQFLYDFLNKHGFAVDKANKNPNRLSRMPGVTRNGVLQELIAVDVGCSSFEEWTKFIEVETRPFVEDNMTELYYNPLPIAPALIEGLIRKRHKLLITGPSKSGKSFLLIELAICLAEGIPFMGFNCMKSKVVYINLEIDRASVNARFIDIYNAKGIIEPKKENAVIGINIRGKVESIDKLVDDLIIQFEGRGIDVIIIDPIYKVMSGDENNASEMAQFCNYFDVISDRLNVTVIYAHHHSKGAQGSKNVMDRASGSGVFARDPDGILDLTELDMDEQFREFNNIDESVTAYQVECITREFKKPKTRRVWFKHPLHEVDNAALADLFPIGDIRIAQKKNPKNTTSEERYNKLIDALGDSESMPLDELAKKIGVSIKTVRNYADEHCFPVKEGIVYNTKRKEDKN